MATLHARRYDYSEIRMNYWIDPSLNKLFAMTICKMFTYQLNNYVVVKFGFYYKHNNSKPKK